MVAGTEDSTNYCPGNNEDADRDAKLDPFASGILWVCRGYVACRGRVVGVTRAIRRATFEGIIAGHNANDGVEGKKRWEKKRKTSSGERKDKVARARGIKSCLPAWHGRDPFQSVFTQQRRPLSLVGVIM